MQSKQGKKLSQQLHSATAALVSNVQSTKLYPEIIVYIYQL